MANRPARVTQGSWPVVEELLERGDPAFVDELRRIHVGEELANYAEPWYRDTRPAARRFLLEYLDRPLNAGRHEGLIKRLFKLAEAAGDDEVMGRFLVCFDRSVRRELRRRHRWMPEERNYQPVQVATTASVTLPRDDDVFVNPQNWLAEQLPGMRLFHPATRAYLRRRSWRYFRQIGKVDPERYLAAVRRILTLYRDEDVDTGLALLDNWGLMHILFHHSEALLSNPTGWTLIQGKALKDVVAAPMFAAVWQREPDPLLQLLDQAQARPVRQWAIQMLRNHFPDALPGMPLDKLVTWLGHSSREMVELAIELLRTENRLKQILPEKLLQLLKQAPDEMVELLANLIGEAVQPDQVSLVQAVDLAVQKPEVVARLGFQLLQGKVPQTESEATQLFRLGEAEANFLRQEMVRWSCQALSASPVFHNDWVLEYLDNRFVEVRAEGWNWLQSEERVKDDIRIWQKMLESPYDNIRLPMIDYLEQQLTLAPVEEEANVEVFDPIHIRYLWASVLLNVQRGARNKPKVVRQLLDRLEQRPGELKQLLPLLTVALRSLRGPEFRAGLVGLVNYQRRHPEAAPAIEALVPELRPTPEAILGTTGATSALAADQPSAVSAS